MAQKFQINNYNKSKLTAILSFAVLFLSGVYFLQPFASDNSYAETHTDSASGAYNGTTYSMTTTVSDLNLELYNVTPAGKATYGKQTVNVTTNAPGGYQLYVQTSGNLAGAKEGTATSDSIAALPSNNAALDMNTWGYTKTTPNEDANTAADQTIWNTPPSTITQVDATSSAATSGRDTDIYYGIKADNTLSGDNYSGTITYTTIANDATTDTLLSVSPTSGNAGTATQITITTSLMTTSSGISASDISATVGSYSCSSIAITSTSPLIFTCNTSTSLTAGTYTVTATISKYGKTYTKTSAYTAITPKEYMQDFTTSKCNELTQWANVDNPSGTTKTLYDSRDEKPYSIRRLADGHCWMVSNLAIIDTTIYSSSSDSSGSFTIPASGVSAGGGKYTRNGSGNYGPYYSWEVATAGTGSSIYGDNSTNYSICPKKWKLPLGDTSDYSWAYLYEVGYSGQAARFLAATNTGSGYLGGSYYGAQSSPTKVGTNGYWWSRTAYFVNNNDGLYARNLATTTNSVTMGSGIRYNQYAIHCIFIDS